jgi:hypothetical protein
MRRQRLAHGAGGDHCTSQMMENLDEQSLAITPQHTGVEGRRATRRSGAYTAYTYITQAVVLCSLAMVASGSGRGQTHAAHAPELKSWFVVHGPPNEEESVFGYVANQEAMEPAMTLTIRPRARGETSDVLTLRRGNDVAACNIDDEGDVVRRRYIHDIRLGS